MANRPFGGARSDGMTGTPVAWSDWLTRGVDEDVARRLRAATMTGRPCGREDFVKELEKKLGKSLTPKRRSPKPKEQALDEDQLELF